MIKLLKPSVSFLLTPLQYAIFLSLVFVTELIAGISGFVFRHEVRKTPEFASDHLFPLQLHCCGVYNYTSWFSSVYFSVGGIPASCCVTFSDCSGTDLKNTTVAGRKVHKQVSNTTNINLCCWSHNETITSEQLW
uniref:Tetraspanin 7 n=1 Tax=Acanthochromis polyacanthus TaxID=80966 RepID=A0A3Q1FVC6_9TELE